jgi:hypothetical protein
MASRLRRGGAQGRDGQKDSALRLMARRTHVRRCVGVHDGGTSGQDGARRHSSIRAARMPQRVLSRGSASLVRGEEVCAVVSIGLAEGGVHAHPCVRERAGMPMSWTWRRASRWRTGVCARLGTAGQICPDTSTTESSALVLTTQRARECRAEEPVGGTALCDASV